MDFDLDDFDDQYGRGRRELDVLEKTVFANLGNGGGSSALGKIYFYDLVKNKRETYMGGLSIASVMWRASAGGHEDILATTVSGIHIRLSRTNSDDTFQIGADNDTARGMRTLETAAPGGPMTALDLHGIFDAVHEQWPRYEQATCQSFAQEILKRFKRFPDNDPEDSFM